MPVRKTENVDPELKTLIFDIAHTCLELREESVRKVHEYVKDLYVLDTLVEAEHNDGRIVRRFQLLYGQRERERTKPYCGCN